VGIFQIFSTDRRVAQLEKDFDELKRRFLQMEQEWDATSMRVTKTLRRLRSAEERRERSDGEDAPLPGQVPPNLPLTTVVPSSDRMTKIRQQLAERQRTNGGEQ